MIKSLVLPPVPPGTVSLKDKTTSIYPRWRHAMTASTGGKSGVTSAPPPGIPGVKQAYAGTHPLPSKGTLRARRELLRKIPQLHDCRSFDLD